jgi:hypothetical protein
MEKANLSGAEEYIAAEIEMGKAIGPHEEKAIRDLLAKSDGVRSDTLAIDECKVTVYYDPARITKDEVVKLISQAGAQPSGVEAERAPLL